LQQAHRALQALVEQAAVKGVVAEHQVAFGAPGAEIVRQTVEGRHDLVIVGARSHSPATHWIIGTTAMALLRKCPSPVWVARSRDDRRRDVSSVLVAHDLSPLGTLALQLGASLAELQSAALHVIHVTRIPEEQSPWVFTGPVGEAPAEPPRNRIESELRLIAGPAVGQVAIAEGDAWEEILNYIEDNRIDLIVLGTVARGGV
ncbi:MAG TPA: universal stress protein, partial [Lacipirellulaceae bacterium]|nr:universal stress protein [Lacipirellulaceae bacterium]